MDRVLTLQAADFVREWNNSLPYITAHTSGSTGKPKEVHLLKTDMKASAQATLRFFGVNSDSVLYLPLSPSYIAGKMQIVRALEAGCSLTVVEPSNHPLNDDFPRPIEILPIVPSQIPGLLEAKNLGLVKNVIIGGAPIAVEDEKRVIAAGVYAYATYGMTETCSHVALRKLGMDEFKALPGFTFTADNRGCLVISTETMSFGSIVTNDIVELMDNKSFVWKGRFDNVINSGGIKIFPEEVERVIAPFMPPDSLFYVTARKSSRWGEEAIIVTDCREFEENSDASAQLFSYIRPLLPFGHLPKEIIYTQEIQLTSSKKIIRRKFV